MHFTSHATVVTNFTQASFFAALTNHDPVTFSGSGTIFLNNSVVISTNTTIDGGSNRVLISGSNAVRVFYVTNTATLTLLNLIVANGVNSNGGGIFNAASGIVNLSNCVLTLNGALGTNGNKGKDEVLDKDGGAGGAGTSGIGGAIYNLGRLNITNSLIATNDAFGGNGGNGGNGGAASQFGGAGGNGGKGAVGWGAGIYNTGTVFMINSRVVDNIASGGNGGTGGAGGAASFHGNPGSGGTGATGLGGGIYNLGTMTITNSTFVTNNVYGGNSQHAGADKNGDAGGAANGGGIYNLGTVLIGNSTFTRNGTQGGAGGNVYNGYFLEGGNGGSGIGGAVYNSNSVTIVSSTFATNNAIGGVGGTNSAFPNNNGSRGASLGGNVYRLSGQVRLRNSIFAGGTSGANSGGTITDDGYNLSSDSSFNFTMATSYKNTNALLGPLANNGGLTPTMALLPNSPAIDKGDPIFRNGFDQRGIARTEGTNSDIGAFELVPTYSISGRITEGTNGISNITVTAGARTTVSLANGSYSMGGLITSNYLVTPTPIGAGFRPASTNVFVGTNAANPMIGINATNVNFAANPVAINGSILSATTNPSLTNAILLLQFTALPQRTYKVQASTNLSSSNWINVSTNLSTTNGLFQFRQTNLAKPSQRFFRIAP